MKKIWVMRKDTDGVSPVVATILLVGLTVVIAAVLYVMVLGLGNPGGGMPPVFGTNVGNDPGNYEWTISAILGGMSVLKTDVYVQLRTIIMNETVFIIATEPLLAVSGTHGFNYSAATVGNYIAVGDSFSLSKSYASGTTLSLVTPDATGSYAVFNV